MIHNTALLAWSDGIESRSGEVVRTYTKSKDRRANSYVEYEMD